MNVVEKLFAHKGIAQPGGWAIYSKTEAIEIVEACQEQRIGLIGIDAFLLKGDGIQPSMENSIDFLSSLDDLENNYAKAIEFLRKKEDKWFFEILYST